IEIRKAAAELRALWVLGNEYLQNAAPWASFKTDPDTAAMQIRTALNLIRFYAVISAPFIPFAAEEMLAAMKSEGAGWPEDIDAALTALAPGHAFATPDVRFAKITDEQRADWQQRFKGSEG